MVGANSSRRVLVFVSTALMTVTIQIVPMLWYGHYHPPAAANSSWLLSSFIESPPPLRSPIFTVAKYDRAGSFLTDMLAAHAYAYHHGVEYGGACELPRKNLQRSEMRKRITERRETNKRLIEGLGLSNVLKVGPCPPEIEEEPGKVVLDPDYEKPANFPSYLGLTGSFVYQQPIRWDERYRAHLQSLLENNRKDSNDVFTIVVHIRRGDVNPCRYKSRYLPNSYYRTLINDYVSAYYKERKRKGPPPKVIIHSESTSFESLDFFREEYDLRLDAPLMEVYHDMMDADVLIMSRSTFGMIPALLQRKDSVTVAAPWKTKFQLRPLPSWRTIDTKTSLMWNQTESELLRMKEDQCDGPEPRSKGS